MFLHFLIFDLAVIIKRRSRLSKVIILNYLGSTRVPDAAYQFEGRRLNVKAAILPYFKNQNPPLISYSYMPLFATKIFNYRDVLWSLKTKDANHDPLAVCTYTSFKSYYQSAGHIITHDLSIVENENLRELLSKVLGAKVV